MAEETIIGSFDAVDKEGNIYHIVEANLPVIGPKKLVGDEKYQRGLRVGNARVTRTEHDNVFEIHSYGKPIRVTVVPGSDNRPGRV